MATSPQESTTSKGFNVKFPETNLETLVACRVIVLEDNDILHLARGSYSIYNLQRDDPSAKMSSVSRALSRLDMEVRPACRHMAVPLRMSW